MQSMVQPPFTSVINHIISQAPQNYGASVVSGGDSCLVVFYQVNPSVHLRITSSSVTLIYHSKGSQMERWTTERGLRSSTIARKVIRQLAVNTGCVRVASGLEKCQNVYHQDVRDQKRFQTEVTIYLVTMTRQGCGWLKDRKSTIFAAVAIDSLKNHSPRRENAGEVTGREWSLLAVSILFFFFSDFCALIVQQRNQ